MSLDESKENIVIMTSKVFGDMSPFKTLDYRCDSNGSEKSRSSYGGLDDRLILDSSIGPLSDMDQSPYNGKFKVILSPMSKDKGSKNLCDSIQHAKPTPIKEAIALGSISDQETPKTSSNGIPVTESSAFSKPVKSGVNRALQFSDSSSLQTPPPQLTLAGRGRTFRNLSNIDVSNCPSSPCLHDIIEVDEFTSTSEISGKFELPPMAPSPFFIRTEDFPRQSPALFAAKFQQQFGSSLLSPSPSLSQVFISSPRQPVRAGSPIRTERFAAHKFASPYFQPNQVVMSPLTISGTATLPRKRPSICGFGQDIRTFHQRSQSAMSSYSPRLSSIDHMDAEQLSAPTTPFTGGFPVNLLKPIIQCDENFQHHIPISPFFMPNSTTSILNARPIRRSVSENNSHFFRPVQTPPPSSDKIYDHAYKLPSKIHEKGTLITPATLAAVLGGQYNHLYERILIVDSRFIYEYEGGHIQNAVHVITPTQLCNYLSFESNDQQPPLREMDARTLLVFYCEYSSKRSPNQMSYIKSLDRLRHVNQGLLSTLHYPEMYLLEGGYKSFVAAYPHLCDPIAGYIPESTDNQNDFGENSIVDINAEQDKILMMEHERLWKANKYGSRTPLERSQSARSGSALRSELNLTSNIDRSLPSPFMRALED